VTPATTVGARRADWRFLLPDPDLRSVAYLPPHDPELVKALELCGAAIDYCAEPLRPARHGLVVITAGPPSAVVRARGILLPGGWLYAEVPGRQTADWERELRSRGFEDVAAHWLWPSERACREMVPLEPGAIRHALGRRDPGARLRVRARAAQSLAHTRAFKIALRRAAVIGRWSP
jgi:hypothetical protein